MEIHQFLSSEAVVPQLRASSKKQSLQELARQAAQITGLGQREIFDVLLERERLGTTGVGSGIAIPHGKLPSLDRLYGIFARAEGAIDFDAIDDYPVDLIFLLLAPETAGADHLKALARVSRLLRDPKLCAKIRKAGNAESIYGLLTATESSNAA